MSSIPGGNSDSNAVNTAVRFDSTSAFVGGFTSSSSSSSLSSRSSSLLSIVKAWDLKNNQTFINKNNNSLFSFIIDQWKKRDIELNKLHISNPESFIRYYKASSEWKTPIATVKLEWLPKLISNESASHHRKTFNETKTNTIDMLNTLQNYSNGRNKTTETTKFLQLIQKTIQTDMTNDNPDIDPRIVLITNTNRKKLKEDESFMQNLDLQITSTPTNQIDSIQDIIDRIDKVSITDNQILTPQNEAKLKLIEDALSSKLKWFEDVNKFITDNSEKMLLVVTNSELMFQYFKKEVENIKSIIAGIKQTIENLHKIKTIHENYKHIIFISDLQSEVIKSLPNVVDSADKAYLYIVLKTINDKF
jgi:hypothetical protein